MSLTAPTKPRKPKTVTVEPLVTIEAIADRCDGLFAGAPHRVEKCVERFTEYGLTASELVADWKGEKAVTQTIAARIVTGYEKAKLADQRRREEQAEAKRQKEAEEGHARYLEWLTEKVMNGGFDSIDEWLESEGYRTLEEYQADRAAAHKRRLDSMRAPDRSLTAEEHLREQARRNMTPKQKAQADRQKAAAWAAKKRELEAEFKARYPRPG